MRKVHRASELVLASFDRPIHPECFGGFRRSELSIGGISVTVFLYKLGHQIVVRLGDDCFTEVLVPASLLEDLPDAITCCNFTDNVQFKYSCTDFVEHNSLTSKEVMSIKNYAGKFREVLFHKHENKIVNWVSEDNRSCHSFSAACSIENDGRIVTEVHHLFGDEKTVIKTTALVGNLDG